MQRALSKSPRPDATHFFCSSGGNAGLACVHAAVKLGHPATIVVPMSTKPLMIAKLRAAGAAEVKQYGATWRDADTFLREEVLKEAEARGEVGVYVPPFDHEDIWAGHSSLVEETAGQLAELCGEGSRPDVLACSVGGGGLLNGVMEGVERLGWRDTQVLAVETKGADSLAESVKQGEHITLPGITSLATTLGAVKVSARTYELATTRKQVKTFVLSDEEAMMGCWRLAEDERLLVELSCSVTVALCYGGRLEKALGRPVKRDDKVVIVVCGGSNVSLDMVTQWKKDSAHIDAEVTQEEKATVASATVMNGN